MSVGGEGKQIHCDGEGCHAVTSLPVALRPVLLPLDHKLPTAEGWLFINVNGVSRHFCPLCAPKQLDLIACATCLEKPLPHTTVMK